MEKVPFGEIIDVHEVTFLPDPETMDNGTVEITPTMIKSGVKIFLETRSMEYDSAEDAVKEIFTAMWAARKRS